MKTRQGSPAVLSVAGMKGKDDMTRAGRRPRARAVRWLADAIASGALRPGDEAPTVNELSAATGVARNTAATALVEAERRRLIERRGPNARKRFVSADSAVAPLVASAVCVIGELGRFADGINVPRSFDAYIAHALVPLLSRAGRHVLSLNQDLLSESDIDALFRTPPAGMAAVGSVRAKPLAMRALERCRDANVPVVVYGNAPELHAFDRVFTDHRVGARMLTEWLLSRGCRRIAPLFPVPADTFYWLGKRVEGYAEAMEAAGLKPLPCSIFGDTDLEAHTEGERRFRFFKGLALAKLVELRRNGGVDALLCLNDDWALPVIAAIRDLGLEPNRDILVAGYDNVTRSPEFGAFESARPAVTVDKHNEKTAADMAALLLARMDGRLPPEPQTRTHDQELVVPV